MKGNAVLSIGITLAIGLLVCVVGICATVWSVAVG